MLRRVREEPPQFSKVQSWKEGAVRWLTIAEKNDEPIGVRVRRQNRVRSSNRAVSPKAGHFHTLLPTSANLEAVHNRPSAFSHGQCDERTLGGGVALQYTYSMGRPFPVSVY